MNWIQRFLQAILTHKAELDAHTRNAYQVLKVGEYWIPGMEGQANTGISMVADTLYVAPLLIARDLTIDRLACHVTTADVGKNARLGIYKDNGAFAPDELLLDAGTVSVGAIGIKTVVAAQALVKGLYWTAIVTDGVPKVVVTHCDRGILINPLRPTTFAYNRGDWKKALAYGVLPNPFGAGGGWADSIGVFRVAIRIASLD